MVALEGQCGGVKGSVRWRLIVSLVVFEGLFGGARGLVWWC